MSCSPRSAVLQRAWLQQPTSRADFTRGPASSERLTRMVLLKAHWIFDARCWLLPQHWPEDRWVPDARRMRELGIAYVRIGEFAWSHYEPRRAEFAWGWLDRVMETLGRAGLKIVLGTPTAAPPKWLMDEFPEIAPIDEQGRPRGFGSRRHYTFSSQAYWRRARASSKHSLSIAASIPRSSAGRPTTSMAATARFYRGGRGPESVPDLASAQLSNA